MHHLKDVDSEHRKEQTHGKKWKPETNIFVSQVINHEHQVKVTDSLTGNIFLNVMSSTLICR